MRIVSLVPSITETLFELGLDREIVGITRFCVRPADRVKTKTIIGGTKNPDVKRVIGLQPDVVVVNIDENRKEDADYLQEKGIRLLVTFPNTIQESIAMIEEFGNQFSVERKAEDLCLQIRSLMSFAPPARRKTVAFIWRKPYITAAPETYVHHICEFFGFDIPVPKGAGIRYPRLSGEEISQIDPEIVLFPDEPYPFQQKHLKEFQDSYPQLKAVREKKLAIFNGQHLTWFGFGTLRALQEFPAIAEENRLWM